MRNPRAFYTPLAVGAPAPAISVPARPYRMIHFFPPHIEKVRAKIPELIPQVDVLLGNLEDAIPATDKKAAREGLIEVAKNNDFGDTSLWTRINSLDSPWVLDDLLEVIPQIGDKLDVVMVPKVEGPWDIHYIDRLLAQLEAKYGIKKSLQVHAILETALGVYQRRGDLRRQPPNAGHQPRSGRPRRVPADEDDARGRRASRLPGDLRPGRRQPRRRAAHRPAGPLALHLRAHGRRLQLRRYPALLRPLRRHRRPSRLPVPVPRRLPHGLRRRLDPPPQPDRDRPP